MTTGLRSRKKQQTRERISNVATTLFFTHGFESTTIADVAAAADVSRMTVTNYFPLKEDLVFDRADVIIRLLADAVGDLPEGTSAADAVRQAYSAALTRRDPILGFVGAEFARLVEASPALQIREREILAAQERELATVLHAWSAASSADVWPRVLASSLAGVYRVLYFEGRRRLLAGETTDAIVRALRRASARCFDELIR